MKNLPAITDIIRNKGFLDTSKVAKQIVVSLSTDKLSKLKKELRNKSEYLVKQSLIAENKKECEVLAEKTAHILWHIQVEENALIPPQTKRDSGKIGRKKQLLGSVNSTLPKITPEQKKQRRNLNGVNSKNAEQKFKEAQEITGNKVVTDSSYYFKKLEDKKKKEREERREKAKARKQTKESKKKIKDVKIYNLPINKLHTKIEPNSVDLILTDPPYEKKALPLFKELSFLAGSILKPGGSLLCMSGNIYLPEVIKNLKKCKNIQYHWVLVYFMTGPISMVISRSISQSYKLILWFTKGKYKGEFINDVIKADLKGEKTNEFHKWGQSANGQLEILKKGIAYPGDTICDPFLGAGSTALASVKRGCKFIGSDIDKECLKITQGRLNGL